MAVDPVINFTFDKDNDGAREYPTELSIRFFSPNKMSFGNMVQDLHTVLGKFINDEPLTLEMFYEVDKEELATLPGSYTSKAIAEIEQREFESALQDKMYSILGEIRVMLMNGRIAEIKSLLDREFR